MQLYTLTTCVRNNNGEKVLNCEEHRSERSWPNDICIEGMRKPPESLDSQKNSTARFESDISPLGRTANGSAMMFGRFLGKSV